MRCKAPLPGAPEVTEHEHNTREEARACWLRHYQSQSAGPRPASPPPPPPVVAAVAPPPPPPIPVREPPPSGIPLPRRSWRDDPVTDKQIDAVERLGGDAHHAHGLTKGECSDYIDRLKKQPRGEAPVTQPQQPTYSATPYSRSRQEQDSKLKMVKGMIDMVPDGNYAVTFGTGERRHVEFIRITRPTSGKNRGKLHIQTRHADTLKTRILGHPDGWWELFKGGYRLLDALMEIIQDYKTCALRYSVEAKACSHCATPLTDDRSRHYLVGPICEKVHGYIWPVLYADEQNGYTFEELEALGKPFGAHHEAFVSHRAAS